MSLFDTVADFAKDVKDKKIRAEAINKCPFCGNKNFGGRDDPESIYVEFRTLSSQGERHTDYFVICQRCWAHGPFKDSMIEAVIAWNAPTNRKLEKKHKRKGLLKNIL